MIRKIATLSFVLSIVMNGYSQSKKTSTKQSGDELITIQISADELRKILNDRNSDIFKDTLSDCKKNNQLDKDKYPKEDYANMFLFKHRKNKGYRKQPFEDQTRYALLEQGVSFVSFHLGFMSTDIDDYLLEPVAIVDEMYNRNFSGKISLGHFVSNNVAIGAKVSYNFADTRFKVSADILDIVIGAKTYEANNVSNRYTGGLYVKNFLPLDAAQRFFIVSETNLSYSYTDGLSKNIYDNGSKITKVKSTKDAVSIGLSPGFMYFMSSGFAFEFNMSPVVAYWSRTRTINNEVDHGNVQNYGLMFKFMPFNINFGFSYFFGLDYNKHRNYIKRMNL